MNHSLYIRTLKIDFQSLFTHKYRSKLYEPRPFGRGSCFYKCYAEKRKMILMENGNRAAVQMKMSL